jgi:hypothetical protein
VEGIRIVETAPAQKRSFAMRWLAISFLGTMGLFLAFVGMVLWKFSPVVAVDEARNRVSLLKGLVVVDGTENTVKIAGFKVKENDEGREVVGEVNLAHTPLTDIHIPFSNGQLELRTTGDEKISWKCVVRGDHVSPIHSLEGNRLTLALDAYDGAKCQIRLPEKVRTRVEGQNGQVALVRPRTDLQVELMNGSVSVVPDRTQQYKYDISVMNGRIDRFESSAARSAHRLNISVMNGSIGRSTAGL